MSANFSYDFYSPQKIVFGWGRRHEVGGLARSIGRVAFIVSGLPSGIAANVLGEIRESLESQDIASVFLETILHEPEVQDVDRVAKDIRGQGAGQNSLVIGVGGGAAIDLAKAVAAMAPQRHSPTVADFLENVGRGLQITERPLPVLAMPSTAGTGAEATRNAVISNYDPPYKKSLRDERILPRIAVVDPELTVTMPAEVTAAGGMDAITQLIESYVSRRAQPIPRALAIQGLKLAVPAIEEAVNNGSSRTARERMSHAALLSGLALANSGLGLAHGVAAALGIHGRVPHGLACALMLPTAMRVNQAVCRAEFAELGRQVLGLVLGMDDEQAAERFIAEITDLCRRIDVPARLRDVGVRHDQIAAIVASSRGNSMSGNPCELSDSELTRLLEKLL